MTDDISKVEETARNPREEGRRAYAEEQASGNYDGCPYAHGPEDGSLTGGYNHGAAEWQAGYDEAKEKAALRIESATTPAEVGEASAINSLRDVETELRRRARTSGAAGARKQEAMLRALADDTNAAASALNEALRRAVVESARMVEYAKEVAELRSALAEATRRLGEVEGVPAVWEKGMGAEHRRICANQLRAALTKEPTK